METEIINKLKSKKKLSYEEINYMVKGYNNSTISDKDMSTFLLLIKNNNLTYKETFYLTKSIIETGEILDLSNINKVVVDKHSTGGVGDKITLIVSAVVSSLDIAVCKMSGRSLGITGGTIDKLESIPGYKVNLTNEEFISNVNKVGVSVMSTTKVLAPADKKIYALRDEIGAVESIPLIASSIMSKKIASGAKYIVIDLKVGKGAFMKNTHDAKLLAKYMIKIGTYFNRKVVCILTDMSVPLGLTVGNALEVKETIDFFNGIRDKRLERLVIEISSYMVSLGKNISISKARKQVLESLNDGRSKSKFYEWISAQHGDLSKLKISPNVLEVKSNKEGYITYINPLIISNLVFSLGAGRLKKEDSIDYSVGIKLNKSLYDYVNKNDILAYIYYTKYDSNLINTFLSSIEINSIIKKKKDIIIDIIK